MSIIIDSYSQGDPQWFKDRLGKPGASSISKIITNAGVGSKQRDDFLRQLAGEILAGKHEETYQSIHMTNGLEREAGARTLFELIKGISVRQVALVYKDERKTCCVSPDGLIGNNSGLEIKCPMLKTHVKYLLANKLPSEYFSQVQMSLYVCEAEYWWFMSYYPGLPELTVRVYRDEKFIGKLERELDCFCMELIMLVKKLKLL